MTIVFILAAALSAQESNAQMHLWVDSFGTNHGAVLYPQYSWSVKTSAGNLSGFGFVEVAPHEPFFTNHLVVFTPEPMAWFSIHTETGGLPRKDLGFFQISPRFNLHEVFPKVKKPMAFVFVTALPRFIGIRPNNLLVAAGTNQFYIGKIPFSTNGYRRFFAGHRPDYAEYWFMAHPKQLKPLSLGAFVLHSGNKVSIGVGLRLQVF
jgi:hypothetical protein